MMVTIFESQTLTGFAFDSNFNAYTNGYQLPAPFVLLDGEPYSVHWDGETFNCISVSFIYNNATMVAVGNQKVLGGEDTKEPFFIFYSENDDLVMIYTETSEDSHTLGIYQRESGIVLKDFAGSEQEYTSVKGVGLLKSDGTEQIYTPGQPQDKTVVLDFSNGDVTVMPDDGYVLTGVEILKPSTLVPENIPEGIEVAGVKGTRKDSGGGEGGSLAYREKAVNFYDWDGTLLCSYTKSEAMALTELPEFPTSEQFGTATAWNWTLSEIQSALSDRYWIDVGAMYTIDHTQFFISLTDSANLTITIEFSAASISAWSGYVLWGDGTKSTVFCSIGGARSVSHTYSEIGDYAIELDTDSQHKIGSFSGATTAIRKVLLGKRCCGSPSNYGANIKEIIVSDGCTGFNIPTITSNYLEFLIIPPSTSMGNFNGFKSLKLLSLPYTMSNSRYSSFHYNNYNLKRARFWGQSSLTSSNFYSCCGLKAVHFNSVQTISNALGDYCYSLETVILPSTLTTISANFFKDSLNAKFYVPDDKVDTFKAMTYMAVHKNRIFPISQIPDF